MCLDEVLGFEATGEIQASDYRDVLMPAVREVWERGDEVRIVLVFERWDGMSSGAAWEDLKVGLKNLTKWKRIALVTDLDWMITVVSLFGWMTPGELKRFPGRRARPGDHLGCGRRLARRSKMGISLGFGTASLHRMASPLSSRGNRAPTEIWPT
jgi:hypothetical protein